MAIICVINFLQQVPTSYGPTQKYPHSQHVNAGGQFVPNIQNTSTPHHPPPQPPASMMPPQTSPYMPFMHRVSVSSM